MKTKIIIILFLQIFFAGKLSAQNDSLLLKELQKPIVNCEIISVNSQRVITGLSLTEQDSILKILNVWENFCGKCEPVLRMQMLLKINANQNINEDFENYFSNFKFDNDYIYRYRLNEEKITENKRYFSSLYYCFVPPKGKFDKMAENIAGNLLQKQKKGSLEYLFCEFIAGNFDDYYEDLKSEEYAQNPEITKMYGNNFQDYLYYLSSGIWIPNGNLAKVFKPSVNIALGVTSPKFMKNQLNIDAKFSTTIFINPNHFLFRKKDSIYTANPTADFNFGVRLVYEKQIFRKTYLRFFSGICVDWIDTNIKTPETADKDNEDASYFYITTYSIPAGVGIRRNIFYHNTVGMDFTYNYTPYNADHSLMTNLYGNYFTCNLFFGF